MSNSYLIQSVTTQNGNLIVSGTVNGSPLTVSLPETAAAVTAMASAISFQTYIQPYMLAAYQALPQTFASLVGTFSA